VVRRAEIFWADLPETHGRRPVVVLTRTGAIEGRRRVTVAPVTRTARGIRSEVAVGKKEGLSTDSVVTADNIMTVPKWALADRPLGALGPLKRRELDHAIRYALDIRS